MLKNRKSIEYHDGHRVATMMGWRSRIAIMYLYGTHNYKAVLVLGKLKKDKSSTCGVERVPQCGYITLITMYLHQNNS